MQINSLLKFCHSHNVSFMRHHRPSATADIAPASGNCTTLYSRPTDGSNLYDPHSMVQKWPNDGSSHKGSSVRIMFCESNVLRAKSSSEVGGWMQGLQAEPA
jgi:hypothetical protein